jgi:thiol-disulfide isomerase/thioredoxin
LLAARLLPPLESGLDAVLLMRTVKPCAAVPTAEVAVRAPRRAARKLRAHTGNPGPPSLKLAGLDGKPYDLTALRGRVVLVEFWASWCPPCAHEMPSMVRLQERLAGRPFTILAVNMAETDKDVRAFLREKVRVDFPILMDRDGAGLKRWNVFVFPTSFVIGPDDRIRYVFLGGRCIRPTPEVVGRIDGLLDGNQKRVGADLGWGAWRQIGTSVARTTPTFGQVTLDPDQERV